MWGPTGGARASKGGGERARVGSVCNNDFNPMDIQFKTLPSMSKAVIQAMLPGTAGEVNVVSFQPPRFVY